MRIRNAPSGALITYRYTSKVVHVSRVTYVDGGAKGSIRAMCGLLNKSKHWQKAAPDAHVTCLSCLVAGANG